MIPSISNNKIFRPKISLNNKKDSYPFDVNEKLHALSIQGEWQKMFDLVSNEMVETLGFCGNGKEVANSLKDELGPFCSAVMWNEIEHLGTDHSQDERMSELLQIVKS